MRTDDFSSFLVVRRDNIGDLVCTLPLIGALRHKYPKAFIAALVNTYNCDVLAGHPDIDAVYAYSKGKHRTDGQTLLGVYWARLRMLMNLRSRHFDCAILAAPGEQPRALGYARWIRPRHILGYVATGADPGGIDLAVHDEAQSQPHEVEKVFALLAPLGLAGPPPAARIAPSTRALGEVRDSILRAGLPGNGPLVAMHISARKPSQRWSLESFAQLARALHVGYRARFLLLWAPGGNDNPLHPGDDSKAETLKKMLHDLPVLAYPTRQLAGLIAALAASDIVVCPDGGAMHLSAALGKPIVCLFGDSDPSRWRPWGVPQRVLQATSRDVADISSAEVMTAVNELVNESGIGTVDPS